LHAIFLCLTLVCILLSVICNKMEVMSPGACFIYLAQHRIRAAPLASYNGTTVHTPYGDFLSLWAHTLHLLCGWFKYYYCQCSVSRHVLFTYIFLLLPSFSYQEDWRRMEWVCRACHPGFPSLQVKWVLVAEQPEYK
jgi:hypothetical protein